MWLRTLCSEACNRSACSENDWMSVSESEFPRSRTRVANARLGYRTAITLEGGLPCKVYPKGLGNPAA